MAVDMDWVRKTHNDYIKGMQRHADELENNNERHLYGAAINRIKLLMEHIAELEAKVDWYKVSIEDGGGYLGSLKAENRKLEAELKALREALRECADSFEEYSAYAGEYLVKKHGVEEELARYHALLEEK